MLGTRCLRARAVLYHNASSCEVEDLFPGNARARRHGHDLPARCLRWVPQMLLRQTLPDAQGRLGFAVMRTSLVSFRNRIGVYPINRFLELLNQFLYPPDVFLRFWEMGVIIH
jgi:hypothetical protein